MDDRVIQVAFVLIFGIISVPKVGGAKEYFLIQKPLNWMEAQRHCRANYTDLATIESGDANSLMPNVSEYTWIGLSDPPETWKMITSEPNSWKWSQPLATEKTSQEQYQNWAEGEPDYDEAKEECVMLVNGAWMDEACDNKHEFVCYNESAAKKRHYVYIKDEPGKWEDAKEYCIKSYTNLAIIENEEDQKAVNSLVNSSKTWIGLSRTPWKWSDGSTSLYRNWTTSKDNTQHSEHCAFLLPSKLWGGSKCSDRHPFICYRQTQRFSTLKLRLQTEADLSDPDVKAQFLKQIHQEFAKIGKHVNLTWKTAPKKENAPDELRQECV